jgi:hypothetical protein
MEPPTIPTVDAKLDALMNASTDNVLMLQALTQHMIPDPAANHTYRDFLKTQPPVFHKAKEALEAEDWICTIKQKLSVIRCSDVQKTQFAIQQL